MRQYGLWDRCLGVERGATQGAHVRMRIDVEALKSYLLDLCGTATFSGISAALLDVAQIERADGSELLGIALRLGVDPAAFEVR